MGVVQAETRPEKGACLKVSEQDLGRVRNNKVRGIIPKVEL